MAEAEIFQHRGTSRRAIRFDTLVLRFAPDNAWPGASWEFDGADRETRLLADTVEEITSTKGFFDVVVIDGQGRRSGPFAIQSAMCGYPHHAFCFLFKVEDGELWSGHTVARAYGRLVVVPYRFDPT